MRGFWNFGDNCQFIYAGKPEPLPSKLWNVCVNTDCVLQKKKNKELLDELCSSNLKLKSQSLEIEKL